MSDTARILRDELADPFAVADMLGLVEDRRSYVRQAGGVIVRCPWHEERTPSCSIRTGADGTIAVRCHGCGASGDALSLVAVVAGLDVRRDFRAVLRRAAELAGRWDLVNDAEARSTNNRRLPPPSDGPRRVITSAPERTYPPAEEIAKLLAACVMVGDDAEATAMLAARGIDAGRIDEEARIILPGATLPTWARFHGRPWTETGHRLILPVSDADGEIRSVRAWRVVEGDSPKRLPPAGHKASGLVLADTFAVAMLRGTYKARRVVVLEGEPDWLTWVVARGNVLAARIGVVAGSWSSELASKVPDGAEVVIRTDADTAGTKYAIEIARSLEARCRVSRSHERNAA